MELAENTIIAQKFRLIRELGRGGMGSVWLAEHTELGTPCAVKFIDNMAATSPEMRERFSREARAAAQLRSPHVVQIFDHGVFDEMPYIAMELLEGEDLGKRLARVGRLSPEQVVAILAPVARALGKAHGLGIVHRDLKPDNIYLVRDDDREVVKILDFGIAKVNSNALEGSANTRTGALLGTPYYMSPEQAQGTKKVDHRSDVWSLGVIAFEALTGVRPFDSEALGDLLMRIIMHPLPVPSAVAPDLPPAVDAWWRRAAARNPDERFATARELVDGLAQAFALPSPFAESPSRQGSLIDILPSAAVSGQHPLILAATTGSAPLAPEEPAPEGPARRRPVALLAAGAGLLAALLAGGGYLLARATPAAGAPSAAPISSEPPAPPPASASPARSADPAVTPVPDAASAEPPPAGAVGPTKSKTDAGPGKGKGGGRGPGKVRDNVGF